MLRLAAITARAMRGRDCAMEEAAEDPIWRAMIMLRARRAINAATATLTTPVDQSTKVRMVALD